MDGRRGLLDLYHIEFLPPPEPTVGAFEKTAALQVDWLSSSSAVACRIQLTVSSAALLWYWSGYSVVDWSLVAAGGERTVVRQGAAALLSVSGASVPLFERVRALLVSLFQYLIGASYLILDFARRVWCCFWEYLEDRRRARLALQLRESAFADRAMLPGRFLRCEEVRSSE